MLYCSNNDAPSLASACRLPVAASGFGFQPCASESSKLCCTLQIVNNNNDGNKSNNASATLIIVVVRIIVVITGPFHVRAGRLASEHQHAFTVERVH